MDPGPATKALQAAAPKPAAAKSPSTPKGRVLVVDDDLIVLQSVGDCLKNAGFDVVVRSQALGTSQWIAQNEVDLILLDLMMPAMSGVDLATFLKKRGLTRRPSIILHSGKNASELGPLVRQTGALAAIQKTADTAAFLAEFERLADRHFRMKEGLDATKKPGKP